MDRALFLVKFEHDETQGNGSFLPDKPTIVNYLCRPLKKMLNKLPTRLNKKTPEGAYPGCVGVRNDYLSSLRTADVSPRSSPLRDVSRGGNVKRPSVAMSEEIRLPFAGYYLKGGGQLGKWIGICRH